MAVHKEKMERKNIRRKLIGVLKDARKVLAEAVLLDKTDVLWYDPKVAGASNAANLSGTGVRSGVEKGAAKPPAKDIASEKEKLINEILKDVRGCKKCPLHKSRISVVFGEGCPGTKVMFVGEGPGYDEDRQGRPFVGRAGQLLTKIIESIGLKREDVYITNIVKCHPMINPGTPDRRGNDRPPTEEEVSQCLPFLKKQIAVIKPVAMMTLGNSAARTLLGTQTGISKLRGQVHDMDNIKLIPTYHPAALLRNPSLKPYVWEDMKLLRCLLK